FLSKGFVMKLFVSGPDALAVSREGESYLSLMAFFYFFPAFTNGIQGFFRGEGDMKVTLICTFIQTSVRVLFTFILVPYLGIKGIAIACALGWSFMLLYEVPYYMHWKRKLIG
ncbi:MAG: polysaccharide biosynthesis C-terminal domain-containing protein, partial [Spirochaetes bacterium]|nr:polysaccharide biosynthesis C-terminal domain-containing protein [Candidatus Ornithospirochaeta stercoripullorum]